MHTTTKIVLAGVLMGAAVAGGTATANAQYYPPPYGYGYGGPTWNDCPPGYTVQGGNCAPYRGPTGACTPLSSFRTGRERRRERTAPRPSSRGLMPKCVF